MRAGSPENDWREDCVSRRVLELFVTTWTSMILHTPQARHGGSPAQGCRVRTCQGISGNYKMLTQTLGEIEASGMLTRPVQALLTDQGGAELRHRVELTLGCLRDQ